LTTKESIVSSGIFSGPPCNSIFTFQRKKEAKKIRKDITRYTDYHLYQNFLELEYTGRHKAGSMQEIAGLSVILGWSSLNN